MQSDRTSQGGTFFLLSFTTCVASIGAGYFLLLIANSEGTTSPTVAAIVFYAASLSFPFVLSVGARHTANDPESVVRGAIRGAVVGMAFGLPATIGTVVALGSRLRDPFGPMLAGFPLVFFGSILLPTLAAPRIFLSDYLKASAKRTLTYRLMVPGSAFLLLVFAAASGTITRRLGWKLAGNLIPYPVLPLSSGWFYVARSSSPLYLVFPILFYSSLIAYAIRSAPVGIGDRMMELKKTMKNLAAELRTSSKLGDILSATLFTTILLAVVILG